MQIEVESGLLVGKGLPENHQTCSTNGFRDGQKLPESLTL